MVDCRIKMIGDCSIADEVESFPPAKRPRRQLTPAYNRLPVSSSLDAAARSSGESYPASTPSVVSSWFKSFDSFQEYSFKNGLKNCSVPTSLIESPPEQPEPRPPDCEGLTIRSASFTLHSDAASASTTSLAANRVARLYSFRSFYLFSNQIIIHRSFTILPTVPAEVRDNVTRILSPAEHDPPPKEELAAIHKLAYGDTLWINEKPLDDEKPLNDDVLASLAIGFAVLEGSIGGVARVFNDHIWQPQVDASRGKLAYSSNRGLERHAIPKRTTPVEVLIGIPKLPAVKPSTAIGYSSTYFPSTKIETAGVSGVAYPFLAIEYKGETCWVADNRCAVACATFSNLVGQLSDRIADQDTQARSLDTTTFGFTTNGTEAHLFVSWRASSTEGDPIYNVAELRRFLVQSDYVEMRNIILNIFQWGKDREKYLRAAFKNAGLQTNYRLIMDNIRRAHAHAIQAGREGEEVRWRPVWKGEQGE